MSFYTALTGLNAATAQLGVTSNNIANVGTTGFKRSRADFGDIFATSPLQKASSVIGQGVALKQVSQEFSQGNIQASANALDLAITGDGFFPLKSADGLQNIYTRNGAFTMNDQNNIVNSAGQALLAASVDSSGKADLGNLNRLSIPKKTTGDAKQTSLVQLGLNFPADANVITDPFNRSNPATFNKTTALTVYDQGGNSYLATVYYVKTQNASQLSPYNKWQTFVYVGDTLVNGSLIQATDNNQERLYVNKYGQIKPESQVADLLVNRKTQEFHLDNLTDQRTSVPAAIASDKVVAYDLTAEGGVNFSALSAFQKAALGSMFSIDVDGSGKPVKLDISALAGRDTLVTGTAIAQEMTNQLNRGFGDEHYFDLSTLPSQKFTIKEAFKGDAGTELSIDLNAMTKVETIHFSDAVNSGSISVAGVSVAVLAGDTPATIAAAVKTALDADAFITGYSGRSIVDNGDGTLSVAYSNADGDAVALSFADAGATGVMGPIVETQPFVDKTMTIEQVVQAMQISVDAAVAASASPGRAITVTYDRSTRDFKFAAADGTPLSIRGGTGVAAVNDVLGLGATYVDIGDTGAYATARDIVPNGAVIRAPADQRYGLHVTFDNVTQKFTVASGTTGDTSSIAIAGASEFANQLLGISDSAVSVSSSALRGIASQPAVTVGSQVAINVNNNFSVDDTNNRFLVTVDNVQGLVTLPPNANYTLDGFISELQSRINLLASESGSTVSGVEVEYDRTTNSFRFTSGTSGSDSFIKVSGSSTWGLANATAGRGTTTSWIKPTQFTETVGGVPIAKYIDERGQDTSSADGFTTLPEWSPIFLDKGELTFDTGGKLISPKSGAQLDTVFLPDGKGALRINIDYSKSTQFSSPFAVLSQSQDGAPEGDLVGVNIGDDGLVNASYSNGNQRSLGKIVLVNFSNPNGLRQIGDGSFNASSASGVAKLGEAGGAGFGTIRAGARERANVDLTQELVDLITAQRNFQASAKAIETSNTLTQSIINIRS